MKPEYEISDWDYILSSVCNGYFSGISFDQLMIAVFVSSNREELDAAISAQIRLNEITQRE